MTNMTLAIPEDLHKLMRRRNEIKWSEIARQALWNTARKLELMDRLLAKSKLTEKDALDIGIKVNKGIAKRHKLNENNH
jgi:hypothetical protein